MTNLDSRLHGNDRIAETKLREFHLKKFALRFALWAMLLFASIFAVGIKAGLSEDNSTNPPQTVLQVQPLFAFFQHMYDGFFNEPMGVFYDPRAQEIYVADTKNDLIGIFNSKGISVFSFGANDDIKEPIKVTTDSQGRIFVLDIDRSKIKIFNYRGEFLRNLDSPELQGKKTIATMVIDRQGNIYVGEHESSQILVFDSELKLKLKFGSKGKGRGQFQAISSIAVDKDGKIYVTDFQAIPVQVFDRNGNFIRGWGEHAVGTQNFSLPGGIAVDSKGRIIVADTLRQEIKVFDNDGKFLQRFGGFGNRPGDVAYPVDVCIDPSDRIYVVEKVGRRVQVFQEVEVEVRVKPNALAAKR